MEKNYNFNETLLKAKKLGISPIKLLVADNVQTIFGDDFFKEICNEEDFETICSIVYEAYMNSETITIQNLADISHTLITEDGYNIANIESDMLIDRAIEWGFKI